MSERELTSVLVLDDRECDRTLLSVALDDAGYEVIQAGCGEDALEIARANRPDVIITDIVMPVMNGYEFVRQLRDDPLLADTVVVFSTANYLEGEVRRLAQACGVTHFLSKPTAPATVIETVASALGSEASDPEPAPGEEFNREQLRVLNDKVVEKVNELEQVSEERQHLIGLLLRAHEDERRWIAQALHDDPIPAMAAVSIRLGELVGQLDGEQRAEAERLGEETKKAIGSLRTLIFELEPVALRTDGLAVALSRDLQGMSTGEIEAQLDFAAASEPAEATTTMLYRMTSEALANVEKHATASHVRVLVDEREGQWLARVSDDGCGFDPKSGMRVRPGHLGLASMRERLEVAGGSLCVESAHGAGSVVEIRIPELHGEPR
jgi:signal transduction histidine kinase